MSHQALETLQEVETVFGMTESIAVYRYKLMIILGRQQEAYKSLEDIIDVIAESVDVVEVIKPVYNFKAN